ncbi:Lrp/AsnC family transcriptional regulator [Streptomyces sp. NPDC058045]|uniref:Lrp/AsnC family transcriptional regulator n=1 Tax=Streptomyces sp. NPDC058045 TaxID=3346311 RepID=UPI0036E06C42
MATYLDTEPYPDRVLDEGDQALAHALQINGRASFREIAAVLGVSDQTVARRWARLRSAGTLRLLGLTAPFRLGDSLWLVRVRCTPDAAAPIGEALARRTDTTWVQLVSGGTEISCVVRTRDGTPADARVLQRLPRTPRVVDMSAHCLLHIYYGHDLGPINKRGPLTPDQAAALTRDPTPRPPAEPQPPALLDHADRLLLDALARDGRTPAAELAATTGLSPSTVRRRITELRTSGVLYFDLEYHPSLLHRHFRAGLWLEIAPASLSAAGTALAAHPEVAFAAATTGTTNIYASVDVPDAQHFYRYLTHSIATLPGLHHTITTPTHQTLKGAGPYAGGG